MKIQSIDLCEMQGTQCFFAGGWGGSYRIEYTGKKEETLKINYLRYLRRLKQKGSLNQEEGTDTVRQIREIGIKKDNKPPRFCKDQ